jgi:glycosyltransferase involved in cell wall biosynthesis
MTGTPRPLRICLPTGIFPPDVGGPASYVPRIAAALTARGHAVRVVTLADDTDKRLPEYPYFVLRIARGMPRLGRMWTMISAIAHEARAADGIFANGLFIEAAIAAALTRKPLVMKIVGDWAWERARNQGAGSEHIEDFERLRQPIRWEAVKMLRTFITRRAQMIIVPSRYLAKIVSGWGILVERIAVVYNALDPLPAQKPAGLLAFEGHTLVTVARLVRWKGIDALIDCVAANPRLRLIVVGEGPEFSALSKQAKSLAVGDRVIFTGTVTGEQVAGWLRAADLFVLNSTYEGLPHIVLEAFDAGVPVLASAAGGTPEIVCDGENGILIPPGDRLALSSAIGRILADKLLQQKLVEGGRSTLAQAFRWDALVKQTETILMNIFLEQA